MKHHLHRGAFFGAFIGDALGAPIEFCKRLPSESQVREALQMKTAFVTDDSDLMLCLWRSLRHGNEAAYYYSKWFRSDPYDVGTACSIAFSNGASTNMQMAAQALRGNADSQANGALMRAPAVGIWGAYKKLSEATVIELATADARLTHPHPVCIECNVLYSLCLKRLLEGCGVHAALNVVATVPVVQEWLHIALTENTLDLDITESGGWVKWAFILAFWHLKRATPFEEAMIDVLRRGGDTDTNACIVGALLGALWGIEALPKRWVKRINGVLQKNEWATPDIVGNV